MHRVEAAIRDLVDEPFPQHEQLSEQAKDPTVEAYSSQAND